MNTKEASFMLRVDESGRVVAMNQRAASVFGAESVGRACDQVVRGNDPDGEALCNRNCAAELASGHPDCERAREARIRGHRYYLECHRVGDQVVVTGEELETAEQGDRLTAREKEILALVAKGLSTIQTAERLGISPATVRTHVEHARGRLGARTRAEAVLRAMQTGQLRIDSLLG